MLDRVSVRAGGSGPGLGELVAKSGDAGGKRSRSVGGEAWDLIMAPACGREAHRGGSPRADGAWRGAMESWAGRPARSGWARRALHLTACVYGTAGAPRPPGQGRVGMSGLGRVRGRERETGTSGMRMGTSPHGNDGILDHGHLGWGGGGVRAGRWGECIHARQRVYGSCRLLTPPLYGKAIVSGPHSSAWPILLSQPSDDFCIQTWWDRRGGRRLGASVMCVAALVSHITVPKRRRRRRRRKKKKKKKYTGT